MRTVRKMKTSRFGLIIFMFFVLSFVCSLCVWNHPVASAEESVTYETVYVGDVMEAEDYTLSQGEGVQAEGLTVVRPSGGIYGGQSFVIEQAGIYEVTYYATVDGNHIEEKHSYMAVRKPKDVIQPNDGASIGFGKYAIDSPYSIKKDVYGALVEFKAGGSIAFAANIKTEKLTSDYNILDLIVMPSVFKETDFERLTVQVADAESPENYVEIIIDSSNTVDGGGQVSYIRAGANGQMIGGNEGTKYHTANYGTQVEHSFRGLGHLGEFREDYTVSENSLTLSIDNESKRVFCGPISNTLKSKLMVNDLDDAAHYKGNPWGGFTSDEVTVTISAGSFSKAKGTVLIKSFGDYNFAKDIVDTVSPELTLEYDENEELPIATVGKEFPIIPFRVKDALDTQVKTDVYIYYLANNGQKINVSHDGDNFVAKYAGEYEIVYYTEDYSGNKAEKTINVFALEKAPEILISIEESEITSEVYQTVSIKETSQIHVFGGNGALRVERTVYSPQKEVLDVKDTLQLTELGDYKVVYKVTDYLQNVQYGVVTVHSVATEKPSFIETPIFDKVLIKGFTYALPQPFVVETVNGKVVDVACKAYVNGVLARDSFKADGESVEIKYVAQGASGTTEWTKTIPVEDTESGKYQSKYFYKEGNVAVTDEKDYLQMSFAEDCAVEFVKDLYSKGFTCTFTYEEGAVHFTSMAIVLTDAVNRNLSVTFRFMYAQEENAWFMQLNGKGEKIDYTISKNILSFTRSEDGWGILDTSGENIAQIETYDNGEKFEGFSNTVYLRIAFGGVESESSIYLTYLCNQLMGYKKSNIDKASDEIKPVILLDEEFQIRQKLGGEARIPTATACDVLGQIREFTIKVEKLDGTVLASGPATQPITLTLNEAGNYLVSYYAKDTNGNHTTISYMMLVNDETAPKLNVKNSLKEEYKVGAKVEIPTYSAADNGKNCYIQVQLILPNNEMRLLQYSENGEVTSLLSADNDRYNSSFKAGYNSFIVEQKGKYILRFVAYDEYYNYVVKEIEFYVK